MRSFLGERQTDADFRHDRRENFLDEFLGRRLDWNERPFTPIPLRVLVVAVQVLADSGDLRSAQSDFG